MTDPFSSLDSGFEDARRQLDDIVKQASDNRARAHALAGDVETLTGEARSPRGEVTVRAGVGGRVDAIVFGAGANSLDLAALGRLTVETIARAQHAAMVRLADRSGELFGAESDIAQSMRRDADQGYPPPGTTLR